MSFVFNTLDYVKEAEQVGFTREQAEFNAEILNKLSKDIVQPFVTKEDLRLTKIDLINEMKLLEQRLTIKMGGMMMAAIGVLTFLLKH